MAFEGLTEKISATFKKLRGKGRLKESDVKEAMREIRMALLEADVSYKVVKSFIKDVTERCVALQAGLSHYALVGSSSKQSCLSRAQNRDEGYSKDSSWP